MEKEKITIETIEKLADLSQLEFTAEEKEKMLTEVTGIIEMLNKCGEVPVDKSNSCEEMGINDLREDEILDSIDSSDAFRNSPISKNGYFGVPKVVE